MFNSDFEDIEGDIVDENPNAYILANAAPKKGAAWGVDTPDSDGDDNTPQSVAKAIRSLDSKMASALSDALPDIESILKNGGSAEDFAKKASSIAQYKLLKDLFSDDDRLSQAAAEKILDRAHGKVAGSTPQQTNTFNIIDASSDKDKEILARKMVFMEELMKRKSLPTIDAEIIDE